MIVDGWTGVLRVILLGASAYVALIIMLRVSGKRTLAKMNAFDLVVTVALGSTLATILLTKDVALAEGVVGFAILIALQYAIAALTVRSVRVSAIVKADPATLVVDGQIDEAVCARERVTHSEVLAAIRGAGIGDLAAVAAVVLETDGSFSVVRADRAGDRSALPGEPGR